ncbi:MAG TPA: response regulator [Bryobacteraceae bacterium]|jgi:two-component system cell cycle sensor histidine kinase/response regulator CckA
MMAQIVLLAEDEQELRDYLAMILEQDGFRVLEAADGIDALSLLRRMGGMVDILVTDVSMPRMTGIELVNEVKLEFPKIPVIYISGQGLRDELHDPRRRVMFLQKPFAPQAIRDVMHAVTAA